MQLGVAAGAVRVLYDGRLEDQLACQDQHMAAKAVSSDHK